MPGKLVEVDAAQVVAVAAAFKLVNRQVQSQLRKAERAVLDPLWKRLVNERVAEAGGGLGYRMLYNGVRAAGGNPPRLYAATSKRKLKPRGELSPAHHYYLWEFGATPHKATYQATSRRGRTFTVTRTVSTQLPRRDKNGRAIFPALTEFAPRAVKLWVQTVYRTIAEAAEGKTS